MTNVLAKPLGPKSPTAENTRGDAVAAVVRSKFPWANIQRIEQGTGDVILGYGKTISQRELRKLRDAGSDNGYVLIEERGKPPRLQVLDKGRK
jgi:hypothetical protein